ncbi:MAG: acyl-ACP--UDP-N-acetylglucosamine O-acyltransferase [Bacteroidia bacterium]|nr:acyl-ACP--UDP-N-acetylglucosamine O-acyltransferase [Bacteroidia bacterium]
MQNNSFIHPDAKIGQNVTIEPFCTIYDNVEIGDNTWIGPRVSLMPGARIGKNCQIHPGAVIAGVPQDQKFRNEESLAIIGDHTIVREYVTVNRGTVASHQTVIGSQCLLMAYVHIGHDCVIHDRVILANAVQLAGHIEVGYHTVVGGSSAIHQFVKIGEHAMIAGISKVLKDIPHYITVAREPLRYDGINRRGLRRREFSDEQINHIHDIYRIIFQRGLNYSQAIAEVESAISPSEDRDKILDFFKQSAESGRGIIRGYRSLRGA